MVSVSYVFPRAVGRREQGGTDVFSSLYKAVVLDAAQKTRGLFTHHFPRSPCASSRTYRVHSNTYDELTHPNSLANEAPTKATTVHITSDRLWHRHRLIQTLLGSRLRPSTWRTTLSGSASQSSRRVSKLPQNKEARARRRTHRSTWSVRQSLSKNCSNSQTWNSTSTPAS